MAPVFPTTAQPFDADDHAQADAKLAREEAAQLVTDKDLLDELACRLGIACMALEVEQRLRRPPVEEPPARRLVRVAYEKYGACGVLQAIRDAMAGERLRKNVAGLLRGEREGLAREDASWCPAPPDGCGEGGGSHADWLSGRQTEVLDEQAIRAG